MVQNATTPDRTDLDEVLPGLHATGTVPLPFMDGVDLRTFVLDTTDGPVLMYNTPGIDASAEAIRALGTPTKLLVNHWHENMYGTPALDVPVAVHEADRAATAEKLRVDETFADRHEILPGIEALPNGAHTAGATFYLWDQGEHRYLFTGDNIWVQDGQWTAVVLGESSAQAFLAAIETMRGLDFDVLVPWPAQAGALPYDLVTPERKQEQLDALEARIRAGRPGPNV